MKHKKEEKPETKVATPPEMICGVTRSWFKIEGIIAFLYFINMKDFFSLFLIVAVIHTVGMIICARSAKKLQEKDNQNL